MSRTPTISVQEKQGNFIRVLRHLRLYEEVILYSNIPHVGQAELAEAVEFLRDEFKRESKGYQFAVPEFNPDAAIWAAMLIYRSAQLMLYRENKETELSGLLPVYNGPHDVSAILSADLMLRFLPSVINKLNEIDPDDALIPLLREIAVAWDYSSTGMKLDSRFNDMKLAQSNKCLMRLYVDRVVENKDMIRAQVPMMHEEIKSALGMYTSEYWNGFEMIKTENKE